MFILSKQLFIVLIYNKLYAYNLSVSIRYYIAKLINSKISIAEKRILQDMMLEKQY